MATKKIRIEKDSLGEVKVPKVLCGERKLKELLITFL